MNDHRRRRARRVADILAERAEDFYLPVIASMASQGLPDGVTAEEIADEATAAYNREIKRNGEDDDQ